MIDLSALEEIPADYLRQTVYVAGLEEREGEQDWVEIPTNCIHSFEMHEGVGTFMLLGVGDDEAWRLLELSGDYHFLDPWKGATGAFQAQARVDVHYLFDRPEPPTRREGLFAGVRHTAARARYERDLADWRANDGVEVRQLRFPALVGWRTWPLGGDGELEGAAV